MVSLFKAGYMHALNYFLRVWCNFEKVENLFWLLVLHCRYFNLVWANAWYSIFNAEWVYKSVYINILTSIRSPRVVICQCDISKPGERMEVLILVILCIQVYMHTFGVKTWIEVKGAPPFFFKALTSMWKYIKYVCLAWYKWPTI